jgi:hypothetical protein
MAEKIGLEAALDDRKFQTDVRRMLRTLDGLLDSTEELGETAKKSGKGVDDMGDAMLEASRSSVDLMAKMQNVKMVMDEVQEIAGKGMELAQLGATAERIEARFDAFASQIGDSTEILEAFQRGAGGAASEMEAMQSASQLVQMQIATSAEEMEELVTIAVRLGDQTQSVTDRTENFALMMANQSLPRLDSYGISSGIVRARILELQAATEGMSREEAFAIAVREEGQKSLQVLGDVVQDSAATFETMEAKMANARVELGKKLAPAFSEIMGLGDNLDDQMWMLVTVFQEFGSTVIKLAPALPAMAQGLVGVAKAMKSVNLISIATNPVLLGLAVTVGALVAVYKTWDTQNKKVAESAKKAVEAAKKTEEGIAELVDEGHEVTMVFRDYGQMSDQAAEKWNRNIATSTALGAVFGSQAKILAVINARTVEVQKAAVAQADTYQEAIQLIDQYNSQIGDSAWHVKGFTEEQYNLIAAFDEFVPAHQAAIDGMLFFTDVLQQGEFDAWGFGDATVELTDAMREEADAAGAADVAMFGLIGAIEDGTVITDENEAAQKRLITELDNQATAADEAKAKEEALKDELFKLAEAHEAAKQAAFEHKEQMLRIAEQMSGTAEKEVIARAGIQQLKDLMKDGLPEEEYLKQLEAIQDKFGLVDQKGRNKAEALELVAGKLRDGKIDGDQYTEMLVLLGKGGADSDEDLDHFKKTVAALPSPTEKAFAATEDYWKSLAEVEEPAHLGEKALQLLRKETEDSAEPTEKLTDLEKDLGLRAGELPQPFEDAQGSVEDFTAVILETEEPLDALVERVKELPGHIEDLGPHMNQAGRNLIKRLEDGLDWAWKNSLLPKKEEMLNAFAEEFHSSPEPKAAESPLRGFFQKGAALVETYFDGMIDEWYNQMGGHRVRLLELSKSFTTLGGGAAGFISQEQRELKNLMRGYDDEMKRLAGIWGVRGRGKGEDLYHSILKGLAEQFGSRGVLNPEQFFRRILAGDYDVRTYENLPASLREAVHRYKLINGLINERNETEKEYLATQEKLNRLQEAQQRLRFLEQQLALLEMIKEQGLDAQKFLGGMKLGAEADAEEILRVTTEVLEAIIRKVEDTFEIGSPSRVFQRVGRSMMQGMAMGVADMAHLPIGGSLMASTAMASVAARGGGSPSNVNNSRSVTVNAGGNQFYSGMDETGYSSRTTRAVERAIRGW